MKTIHLTRKAALGAGAAITVLVLGAGGAAYALSESDDDERERPIPAADLEQAERAALAETGGGVVTGTEIDDEDSRYEVEVTLDDGTQIDVQLDEDFNVVSTDSDGVDDDADEGVDDDEPGDD